MFLKGLLGNDGSKDSKAAKLSDAIERPRLIKYDFPDNKVLVHKEGDYAVMQDSQLIVGSSQTVIMARNGQIYKRFDAGAKVLDTGALRTILAAYDASYKGGKNGPPVDFYFINNLFSDALPWGTPEPIQIIDPVLDILIKIAANGQLRYQIVDPELYIITNMSLEAADLNKVCKQKVMAHFSNTVQSYVKSEGVGYFELAGQTVKLSERLRDLINAKLVGEEGFKIVEFTISGFHADNEDLATLQQMKNDVMKMKREAEARAYARSVEGYTYQEERRFDVMQDAASNSGNLGGMMGTMVGATLGMNMGNEIGNKVASQTLQQPPASAPAPAPAPGVSIGSMICANCSAEIAPGSKFCSKCGTPVPSEKFCNQCGTKLPADALFCHSCGKKQG